MNIENVIKENNLRLRRIKKKYDPYTGQGSPIKRFMLRINSERHYMLPVSMCSIDLVKDIEDAGAMDEYVKQKGYNITEIDNAVIALRIRYDFEYWGATCVKIQDKLSKNTVPFIMRPAQRKLFITLYNDMIDGRPLRVILLKARQWGGSTFIQMFMAWIQLFHRSSWHSVIIADVEDQSRNIKSMYTRLADNHPQEILPVEFKNFEGSSKTKYIPSRDAIVYIGSMQSPDSIRSADIMMAHLSEVGVWRETNGRKPEDMVQSIAGSVPLVSCSLIAMESTAKGVGNFFHRQWMRAVSGENGYRAVFVAWYEIEIYSIPFKNNAQRRKFAETLSDQEQYYFSLGATLEAINWYRTKKHTDGYDDWRMGCEFPTTPAEAFQSTGRRAHNPGYVVRMREFTSPPLYMGDMFADSSFGDNAIDGSMVFRSVDGGALWLWALPDKELKMKNRYIVSMDIGGRSNGADWSVISIIDRYWLTDGGVEECIGTCRFHLDQDLAVWKAVQIAKYFNDALLVVESNSLNLKGVEGDHSLTILDEIRGFYDNIYFRTDSQKINEGMPVRYGFNTNRASKTDVVNQMNKRLRECGYIERDSRALDEVDCYEMKENGSYGAVEGGHDDIYMSRAIGLKASQVTDVPRIVKDRENVKKREIFRNEAVF